MFHIYCLFMFENRNSNLFFQNSFLTFESLLFVALNSLHSKIVQIILFYATLAHNCQPLPGVSAIQIAQHRHNTSTGISISAMYPNFCEHKTTTIRKYNLIIYNWTNDERNWVLFLRNQKAKVVCCLCCSLHFVCRCPTDWALPVLSVCSLSAHTWR